MGAGFKIVGPNGNVSEWQEGITPDPSSRSTKTQSGFTEYSVFVLDLASQFPVEDLLSRDFYRNVSIPLDIVPNIMDQVACHACGSLFSTNDSFYVYGSGTFDPSQETRSIIASYNMTSNAWSSVKPSGGEFNGDPRLWGQTASDPVTGMSYFTGGANNIQGMLEFNASDSDHVTWANITQGAGLHGTVPIIVEGGMVFLPFGEAGVLLLLGGALVSVSNSGLQLGYQ
ncbi:MAG: hypothetical protein Q9195_008710 [Heterodermia aff. obscurata]